MLELFESKRSGEMVVVTGIIDAVLADDNDGSRQGLGDSTALDHLGIDQAAIVGHSMGGMVASRFGMRYPQAASHVVFVNQIGLSDSRPGRGWTEPSYIGEKPTPQEHYERVLRGQMRYYNQGWKPEYLQWAEAPLGLVYTRAGETQTGVVRRGRRTDSPPKTSSQASSVGYLVVVGEALACFPVTEAGSNVAAGAQQTGFLGAPKSRPDGAPGLSPFAGRMRIASITEAAPEALSVAPVPAAPCR